MAKRPLTKEEQVALDLKKYERLISNPVFRSAPGTSTRMGNLNRRPENAAAIAQLIQNNPRLNLGSLSPINEGVLINDVNASTGTPNNKLNPDLNIIENATNDVSNTLESTTDYKSPLSKIPYTQGLLDYLVPDQIEKNMLTALAREGEKQNTYGGFTPKVEANTPQGLSNIETLLGNAYMPQVMNYGAGKGPSNKQMIDAAILRAGLELGKGRLPGENFGVALNRGMEAFGAPAKTLAAAQAAAAKLAAAKTKQSGRQVNVTKVKREAFGQLIDTIYDTDPNFKISIDLLKQKVGTNINSNLGDEQRKAIELEAMAINASTGIGVVESIKKATENFLTGEKTLSINNQNQEPTQTGLDKFADKNIKIKK